MIEEVLYAGHHLNHFLFSREGMPLCLYWHNRDRI